MRPLTGSAASLATRGSSGWRRPANNGTTTVRFRSTETLQILKIYRPVGLAGFIALSACARKRLRKFGTLVNRRSLGRCPGVCVTALAAKQRQRSSGSSSSSSSSRCPSKQQAPAAPASGGKQAASSGREASKAALCAIEGKVHRPAVLDVVAPAGSQRPKHRPTCDTKGLVLG